MCVYSDLLNFPRGTTIVRTIHIRSLVSGLSPALALGYLLKKEDCGSGALIWMQFPSVENVRFREWISPSPMPESLRDFDCIGQVHVVREHLDGVSPGY